MKHRIEVEWRSPTDLIPYANNAKSHTEAQVDGLASRIAAFGFDQPIVVDKDGVIVKGHCRRLAAMKLGMDKVPVVVARHLDKHQAMAARIADNKDNESTWDNDLLKLDLGTLNDLDDFDTDLTGFGTEELDAILSGWSAAPGAGEPTGDDPGLMGKVVVVCPVGREAEVRAALAPVVDRFGDQDVFLS